MALTTNDENCGSVVITRAVNSEAETASLLDAKKKIIESLFVLFVRMSA